MPLSVGLRTVNLGTRSDRFKQGKELRRRVPRETHADLKALGSRSAVAILAESDPDRVPELVPERYKRMMANPFAFLRGAAAVMAADLAQQPTAGVQVQAGGDSHLMNFGAFATPEDNILFDVNDFDETLPAVDFTVDLKRLATSVAVATLANGETKKYLVFKAVGVGSVGTFCCVALLMTGDNEPLFLQVKQAQRSVLERLGGEITYDGHQGRRVVEGQQMMQAASDIFLGYTQDDRSGRQFYVRTLKNHRLGGISEIGEVQALSDYARLCGRTLARAHARSGDPAVIAGYMGKSEVMDDAIASFAMAYAGQTIVDHAALVKAKANRDKKKPKLIAA